MELTEAMESYYHALQGPRTTVGERPGKHEEGGMNTDSFLTVLVNSKQLCLPDQIYTR